MGNSCLVDVVLGLEKIKRKDIRKARREEGNEERKIGRIGANFGGLSLGHRVPVRKEVGRV